MVRLPGTTVSVEHLPEEGAFAALQPVFAVSGGGLSLSQVAELTGQIDALKTRRRAQKEAAENE